MKNYCIHCKIEEINYRYKRCRKCYDANRKDNKSKCIDCNIEVSRPEYVRCDSCDRKYRIGENHHSWKGGISNLISIIKGFNEYRNWRTSVFQRDHYTCQDCGINNGKGTTIWLEAHHIKPLSIILKEFLQKYNQFSTVEEKYILARLALSYPEFWDITNGETLCEKCHDKITYKKVNI